MKVQESLVQFLYETKKLSLPGFGHFTLDAGVNVFDKPENALLEQAIRFTFDTKAAEDPDLINHLVKTTGKMKPLAVSDLESYLSTGKQLLNIGKPFILPGIGSLSRDKDGIAFSAGQFVPPKLEDKVTDYKLRDKTVEEPNFSSVEKEFEYEEGSRRNSKKWLIALAAILVLAIAGWAAFYFIFSNQKETADKVSNETTENTDTAALNTTDTTAIKNIDTITVKPASIAAIPDSIAYTYAVQLRQYNYAKSANDRIAVLKTYGHKIFLEMQDSTHYNLLMPINGVLTDSTKVIDSLSRLLLGPSSPRPQVRIKQ